jgi:hypothetical protein
LFLLSRLRERVGVRASKTPARHCERTEAIQVLLFSVMAGLDPAIHA